MSDFLYPQFTPKDEPNIKCLAMIAY